MSLSHKLTTVTGCALLLALALAGRVAPSAPPAGAHAEEYRSHVSAAGEAASIQAEHRLDGAYGLWVREEGDQIHVSWITREPGPGYLRVLAGDRMHHEQSTSPSPAHTAAFPRPRARAIVLEYGGQADALDRHRTTIYLDGAQRRTRPVFSNVDSIFAVPDVHGEYDRLIQLLQNGGVIDEQLRWRAGRSHLVMLGDYFSRGPDVTRVLWFLYQLERQAEQHRGRVHVLLGNHEIMAFIGDLRYLSPKEGLLAVRHGVEYSQMFDLRHSILGRWLASKPALVQINGVLYAHGGLTPDYLEYSVASIDDTLAAYMQEDFFYHWADSTFWADPANLVGMDSASLARREDFFWGENSIFWYRGYVHTDTAGEALQQVLRRFRSDLHVVAHTPIETMQERYDGALIATHPRLAALEMLLLVREGRGQRRYRVPLTGPPEPLRPTAGDRDWSPQGSD